MSRGPLKDRASKRGGICEKENQKVSVTKAKGEKGRGRGQIPQMLSGGRGGGTSIKMTVMEVINDLDKTSFRGVEETEDWFQHLTYLLR